jgi:DNA-binding NarL/FixJ family response regulator
MHVIKILIADDHAIVRQGLRQLAGITPDLVCAGEARNGFEVLERIHEQEFQLLLLDLTMPGPGSIELIKRVRSERPTLPILVLSMHCESQIATRVLKAGASGYITKDNEPEVLISAIRKVAGGGRYIDPLLAEKIVFEDGVDRDKPPADILTDREFEVLQLFAAGHSINEIASRLCLSAKTITTHKIRIMRRLDIHSNADLIRYALTHGIAG